jgi:hypothetical protein
MRVRYLLRLDWKIFRFWRPSSRNTEIGGARPQQTLLAKAFVRHGLPVSMGVGDYGQQDSGVQTFKAYSAHEGLPVLRFVHPRWTKLCAALRRAAADVYYVSCAGAQVGQVAIWAARNVRRNDLSRRKRRRVRPRSDADLLLARPETVRLRTASCRGGSCPKREATDLPQRNYGVASSVASLLVVGS